MSLSRFAMLAAAVTGAALVFRARRRGEVWHSLADRVRGKGP